MKTVYKCPNCGHTITVFVKLSENPTHTCNPNTRKTYVMEKK